MLTFEAFIADNMPAGHFYDIINLDFKKAFKKIPHAKVIPELTNKGVKEGALKWFSR